MSHTPPFATDATEPLALYSLPPSLSNDLPSDVNARPVSTPFVSGTVTFHQPSHDLVICALPVAFGLEYTRQYALTRSTSLDGL